MIGPRGEVIKTYNDLVYAVARRIRELGEYKMDDLRSHAGWNCNSPADAIRFHKYETRGSLLEIIITEEFCLENDLDIEG